MNDDDDEPREHEFEIVPVDLLNQVREALLQNPAHYKLWQGLSHAEPMANTRWLNSYRCGECGAAWDDVWVSDGIENECEKCGHKHLYPVASVELAPILYHRGTL